MNENKFLIIKTVFNGIGKYKISIQKYFSTLKMWDFFWKLAQGAKFFISIRTSEIGTLHSEKKL